MEDVTFWFAGFLAAFCVGLGKGGVPVITALAVPIMSLFMSPILAAGLLLPVFIVADMFGLVAYRKLFSWPVLRLMLVAMPVGVAVGWATSAYVTEQFVKLLIGLIGGWFALAMILRKPVPTTPQEPDPKKGMFWGGISGFTSFVSHSGAVPYQIYTLPLGMDKLTFTGTVTVAFAYVNLVKLIPYYALGQLSFANLQVTLALLLPAVIGVYVGVRLIRIVPEKLFFKAIIWTLLGLSAKLIWDGVTGG